MMTAMMTAKKATSIRMMRVITTAKKGDGD
jgi:hypothetical protein